MNYDKENVLAQPVPPHPAASTAATATQPSAGEDQEYMYGEEDEQGTSKEAPCVVRGRKSWKYLKSIGLHASLVLVPDHKGQSAVAYANSTLGTAEANDCYDTQNSDFDLLMRARVTAKAKVGAKAWPIGAGPETDPGLIDLLGSTTVAMQMMQHLGYSEAQKILGYRLSGGAALGETAKSTAHAKVTALCEMIDGAKTATGGTPSGVLLFNYRLGEVNKQHNANKDILEQVCKVAADMGYVTIVIPQMSSGQYKTNLKGIEDKKGGGVYIFDLLDVKTPDAQFMDNTAKAYFWHLVASFMQGVRSPIGTAPINAAPVSALATGTRPPVIGLVDGRSGSTDLPAFVGLRVYSWEEPMLAALGDAAGPTASGAWTSMYYKIQGPQAMRLFNQYPIVVTGFLDLEGFTKHTGSKGRQYKKLNVADKTLTKWLDNTTTNPFPPLPQANPVWMRKFFTDHRPKSEKMVPGGLQVHVVSSFLTKWDNDITARSASPGGGPLRSPSRANSNVGTKPYERQDSLTNAVNKMSLKSPTKPPTKPTPSRQASRTGMSTPTTRPTQKKDSDTDMKSA